MIWSTFCIWKASTNTHQLRALDYVFALPLLCLTVLRGDVGTDTDNYLANVQGVIQWGSQSSTGDEVGYVFLVRFLAIFTSSPRMIVAVISLRAALLFFAMLYLWENRQCFYSLIFVPLFFFSLTMNTLRIGIAFPLVAISVLQLEKRHYAKFCIYALLAISMQMTTIILLPMLLLARQGAQDPGKWVTYRYLKKVLYALILGAPLLYLGYNIFEERIISKLVLYYLESAYSHEGMSGTFPLFTSFVCCLVAIWFSEKKNRYLGLIFFIIQAVFYGVTTMSYAGIRLQTMALFAQILALSYWAKRPVGRIHFATVILLFCLAVSGMIQNFIASDSQPYAFTPYQFFWESQ